MERDCEPIAIVFVRPETLLRRLFISPAKSALTPPGMERLHTHFPVFAERPGVSLNPFLADFIHRPVCERIMTDSFAEIPLVFLDLFDFGFHGICHCLAGCASFMVRAHRSLLPST
jgi:hypothetical protein